MYDECTQHMPFQISVAKPGLSGQGEWLLFLPRERWATQPKPPDPGPITPLFSFWRTPDLETSKWLSCKYICHIQLASSTCLVRLSNCEVKKIRTHVPLGILISLISSDAISVK